MKKVMIGLMASLSMLLTACGDFQSINKSSNEVLGSLSPFLSEEDQQVAFELAQSYNEEIVIRENLMDNQTVEIEIEGLLAQLEVINKDGLAFKFNGKNVYFEQLKDKDFLESLIASSLVKATGSNNFLSLLDPSKSEAFLGGPLTGVFSMVVKGIFNFAMVKLKDKVGGNLGPIGDIVGAITGGSNQAPGNFDSIKDNFLGNLLGSVLGKFTGGFLNLPGLNLDATPNSNTGTNGSPSVNPQQPQQNCNLFCSLFGLLINNIL